MKGKSDTSKLKANEQKSGETTGGIRVRTDRPYITGPRGLSKVSSNTSHKTNRKVSSKSSSSNHLLCKEVFENNSATVEVTVKAKAPKNRKRHRSNILPNVPKGEGVEDIAPKGNSVKQYPEVFDSISPPKINTNIQRESKHHKHKHLSWAHLLRNKDTGCIIHSEKDQSGKKGVSVNDRKPGHIFKNVHEHAETDDSAISSVGSDISRPSDQESVHYINRSVQCYLPQSTATADKYKLLPPSLSSKCSAIDDGSSNFSMFNPVRTLNFLIKELRGILQKCGRDDDTQRIITDMEHALLRISPEATDSEIKENVSDVPARNGSLFTRFNQIGFVPLKPAKTSLSKPVLVPKPKLAEPESIKQTNNFFPILHKNFPDQQKNENDIQSLKPVSPMTLPTNEKNSETHMSYSELRIKCATLELACKQLELTCDEQKKEKAFLLEQIESQKKQLELMTNKEKDYLTTVSYLKSNLENMSKKAEEQAKCITELSTKYNQLREENEVLRPLRESQAVLTKHLQESNDGEKKIQTQLQIMKLECEKFEVLLSSKDRELEKFKQEFRNIQIFALEQLQKLKSSTTNYRTANKSDQVIHNIGDQSLFNSDSDMDSVATEVKLFFQKSQTGGGGDIGKQPICSSPTSSINSSLGIYPSWRKISNISPSSSKFINKKLSAPELITLSPAKNVTIKESEVTSNKGENVDYSLSKENSLEFKSFLLGSMPGNTLQELRSQSLVSEPKTCEELKNELRGLFERMKTQAKMSINLSLPSPPHHYSEMSEPGGMSQWSETSCADSLHNSVFYSATNTEMNNGKYNLSTTGISIENRSDANV